MENNQQGWTWWRQQRNEQVHVKWLPNTEAKYNNRQDNNIHRGHPFEQK